jgi:hypothetical protein
VAVSRLTQAGRLDRDSIRLGTRLNLSRAVIHTAREYHVLALREGAGVIIYYVSSKLGSERLLFVIYVQGVYDNLKKWQPCIPHREFSETRENQK